LAQIGPGAAQAKAGYDRVEAAARLRKLDVLEVDEFVREKSSDYRLCARPWNSWLQQLEERSIVAALLSTSPQDRE